ncbi:MAG TPA: hypothetical protein VNL69_07565 [Bacteroidota bacterium]|nr:hypothetical protein [Bacteroidota bacterium]
MKTTLTIATALVLLLAGCQKPTEVQVTEEASVDVEDVLDPDASFERAGVDSTALLPREQQTYAGFFTVTAVRTDLPTETRRSVIARAVVENKRSIVEHNGRKMYMGRLLGFVRINNLLMIPRERLLGNVSAGFEYVRELSSFVPGQVFQFSADSVGLASIEAPDVITADAPTTGQTVQRERDLSLQWRGTGKVEILVSSFTPPSRVVPLLRLRPKVNTGRAVVPRRVLRALPRGVYVFTFVLTRRDERPLPGRFGGTMLVQASSVHNVMVEVR